MREIALKIDKSSVSNLNKAMQDDETVTITGKIIATQNTIGATENIYLKAEAFDIISQSLTREQLDMIKESCKR